MVESSDSPRAQLQTAYRPHTNPLATDITLAAFFLALLLGVVSYVGPRTKEIIAASAEDTVETIHSQQSEHGFFGFPRFRSWHRTAHVLDRGKWRLEMTTNLCTLACLVGLVSAIFPVVLELFGDTLVNKVEQWFDYVSGGALLVAILAIVYPVSLLVLSRTR